MAFQAGDLLQRVYETLNNYSGDLNDPHTYLQQQLGAISIGTPSKSLGSSIGLGWSVAGGRREFANQNVHPESVVKAGRSRQIPSHSTATVWKNNTDPPQPNPAMPSFQNEFANIKIPDNRQPLAKEQRHQRYGPISRQRSREYCSFCKKNGEHASKYLSHRLLNGREISCPILANFTCSQCNQKGHTISYCPGKNDPLTNGRQSIVRILTEHNKSMSYDHHPLQ